MRNIVLTSDNHLWLIPGFLHQWNKYCGQPITVVGFTKPEFKCDFVSLGKFEDYPVNRWSNALLKTIDVLGEEHLMIMLEDYWLIRPVRWSDVIGCYQWMKQFRPETFRFCLTSDRLYTKNTWDVGSVDSVDVIESEFDGYHVSFQASIYNTRMLKQVIIPDETPWQSEINGTSRLGNINPIPTVLSTRQWLIRYQVMVRYGKFEVDGSWLTPSRQLDQPDLKELQDLGYAPK